MSHEGLQAVVHHLEHLLPGQAPIQDFVHHNTIHGYQHLPFAEALAAVRSVTGVYGYLPAGRFRALLREGRIDGATLEQVLLETPELGAGESLGAVTRGQVYRVLLEHDLEPLSGGQLAWALAAGVDEGLWSACLEVLALEPLAGHVEELVEVTPEQVERLLAAGAAGEGVTSQLRVHHHLRRQAEQILEELLGRVGREGTLRGVLRSLTGRDLLEELRPYLVRQLAGYLDHGVAAWPPSGREAGLYAVWRENALRDAGLALEELPGWRELVQELPATAAEAVAWCLTWLGLAEERWGGYLERLALELPGWSGMVMWRSLRPGYQGLARVSMMDYLAVRLVLERLYATRICQSEWQLEPRLETLAWHFRHSRGELVSRWLLFGGRLPEYLASRAQRLLVRSADNPAQPREWEALAHLIWVWRHAAGEDRAGGRTPHGSAWPLMQLAQRLGLDAAALRAGGPALAAGLLECRVRLDEGRAGFVWLQAYERQYRDQVLNALAENYGRGRWRQRTERPRGQVIFCMDDREEGIRRHLEELEPSLETLGAAGFFGTPMYWLGLDDEQPSALCPIVVTPVNEVREQPRAGSEAAAQRRARQRRRWQGWERLLFRDSHRGVVKPLLLTTLLGPWALALTAAKLAAPLGVGRWLERLRSGFEGTAPSGLQLTAPAGEEDGVRLGFTVREQVDRVEGFLRTVGLSDGFAPLVVLMGHGSSSQNNPHRAAYDCGACSGRHGGPNARVFAAMANRAEVRAALRERGVVIPDDTWFVGAEHDTADESIVWYDVEQVPAGALARLQAELEAACARSAHERGRRLASAPKGVGIAQALAHVAGRSRDFTQARPELGHVTNAAAFIGRRAASQGVFFDRRLYLISYDPSRDPEGRIVEGILLAAGPVGAGISLEYYFSTVDNDRFGCGTKVVHNVTGYLGVMEGTSSDLRTGLPSQMIEIHEAMRLLVIVEQTPEVLGGICARQAIVRELVDNGWIQLAAMEPEGGRLHVYQPGRGWQAWQGPRARLPVAASSTDWYEGHSGPLAPALIGN